MEDTSGFYKLDGSLLYGHDLVLNSNYELRRDQHETHSYPVDGWRWFDSEQAAREFHGLPELNQADDASIV
jgi:hypothetical protein